VKNQTALPALRNRKSFQERYNKNVIDDKTTDTTIQSNHYLYTERTTMYVMANLSRRDEPATIRSTDSEMLLCTLIYDKTRKLLTINPDLTIDDEHKQHYNVTNDYGVRFNYWIEHVSEERTPLELQEHLEDVRRVSMRLITTRMYDRHTKLSRHHARNDQKDGLFVERPISAFPSDVRLFVPQSQLHLITNNSFRSDSFALSLLFRSLYNVLFII